MGDLSKIITFGERKLHGGIWFFGGTKNPVRHHEFQVAARSTSLDMTAVFHAWPYGRFIEIQSNLSRKKIHRTNQGSNFLGERFSSIDNVRAPIWFRRESQPQHINDTHGEKLNSVQEFVRLKPWLLLIFLTCLHNQLKLYNLIKSTDT